MSGNDDELMIVSSLDQSLVTDNSDILDWVSRLIDQSIAEHDPAIAINGLKGLIKVTQKSGLGLAKGIYLLKKNWDLFELDETFEDAAYIELGVHKHTVDRYVSVWSMYDTNAVPEEIIGKLQQQNIKSQIPIAKAIDQGYEINEDEWERLVNAPDFSTVATIIREEVKGKEPRKGSLQLFMNTDGEIKAFSDGDFYRVGWLDTASDAEPVQKAVNRIVSNGGILKR